MRKAFLTLVFFLPAFLMAQDVTNVRQKQVGDAICIYYDLSVDAFISLYYSIDGGISFEEVNSQYIDGDGYVHSGKDKSLTWFVLQQYPSFVHDDVRFLVVAYVPKTVTMSAKTPDKKEKRHYSEFNPAPDKHRFYILADFAWAPCPQYSGGFMLGTVRTWGWYTKLHLSFTPTHLSTSSRTDSNLGIITRYDDKPYFPDYTGKDSRFLIALTAGVVARLGIPIYFYSGLGYGSRQLYWETKGGSYVNLTKYSHRGVAIDAGLMYDIWHIRLKTGITTINFTYLEYDFGIGYRF